MSCQLFSVLRGWWRVLFCVSVPLALLPLPILADSQESRCGFVVLIMAIFFLIEPIPLAATALLPVVLFPITGVLSTGQTCAPYMKDTIMMYLGGLIMASAVEHCNLHKRIALKVLLTIGTGARWLMLGFMLTTMFLSMWISNTATTAMMVPIVEAVLDELEKDDNPKAIPMAVFSVETVSNGFAKPEGQTERKKGKQLRKALLLSIAYAANCGGSGTIIGSGPNMVLKGLMEELFPDFKDLTFATWIMYNSPTMLICVILTWIFLQLYYVRCGQQSSEEDVRSVIQKSYEELGPLSFHEGAVTVLFLILVCLWFLRDPQFIDGWATKLPYGRKVKDATPAIAICMFLFAIPAKPSLKSQSPPLLDWKTAQRRVPWGILLLLGSGFTVAEAAKKSGLSVMIGKQLSHLNALSPDVILVILCFSTSALTEVVSNMSMATIVLPVVAQMATSLGIHPLFLMLPVTISVTFAFMLPVGNPSNAIVFDSGSMTTFDMVKAGFLLKILCCGVEIVMIKTLGNAIFGFDKFPDWANSTRNS